ncbi:MAG: c-type cytochrome [Vicinamibacterales bacterium]
MAMRGIITIACALMLGASATAQMRWTGSAWEGEPMNLQVLPKDIPSGELVRTMRSFTRALGVRCEHCHAGEGNDLSKFDFMSDKIPAKQIARKMLTMVMEINDRHLADVVVPAAPAATPPDAAAPPAAAPAAAAPGQPPAPRVTCYTCHRGALKPLTAPPPAAGRGGGEPRLSVSFMDSQRTAIR